MFPAFLSTICFSISIICGNRSAKLIGGSEANFWRLTGALTFLGIWAFTFGKGFSGISFPLFFISGIIGIGVGDVALFQALPRIGSRLSILLIQCLTAPFAAAIEFFSLHTRLTLAQEFYAATILAGIGISLMPDKKLNLAPRTLAVGVIACVIAALGGACGAVLSRKAYAVATGDSINIDGGTAAFQRVTGGLLLGGLCLLIAKWRTVAGHLHAPKKSELYPSRKKWAQAWPWILANSFAGQTLGVSCYQWAFKTTPTGIVLPIVATTPLVAIPFAWWIEKERPTRHTITGGIIAVCGVIGLALHGAPH